MSRRKQAVFGVLSAATALLVGYVFVEIGFRVYLYATNEIDARAPLSEVADELERIGGTANVP